MVDKNLDDLHPDLKGLCEQMLADCTDAGIVIKVTETWRDPAREDELHAKGITAATGANCKHCFEIDGAPASKAFDFICLNSSGGIIGDGTDPIYEKCGEIGKTLGLKWGGDFSHPDWDHMELVE